MPSPIPVDRFLPRDLSPSIDLRPCSSPLELSRFKPGTLQSSSSRRSAGHRLPPRLAWCSIDWEQVRLLEPLGSGGFGSVYRATYRGQTVAIKKVKRCSKNRLASRQSFWAELNAARLRHPHVVQVLAASASCPGDPGSPGTIIMEYTGTTTLHRRIYSRDLPLGRDCCLRYASHVTEGLCFLHRGGVVHLDLKPANVLLAPGDLCKIGDFGCSQRLWDGESCGDSTQLRHLGGTYTHRAPELLRGEPVTVKADIYSFAVTLWQMVTRELPYTGDRQCVLYAVVAYDLRPSMGQVFMCTEEGQAVKDLVQSCWAARPEDRPSAEQVRQRLNTVQGLDPRDHVQGSSPYSKGTVQGLDPRDHVQGSSPYSKGTVQGLDPRDHVQGSSPYSKGTVQGLDPMDHVQGSSPYSKGTVQGLDPMDYVQGSSPYSNDIVQRLDYCDNTQESAPSSMYKLDHLDCIPASARV